MQGAIAEALYVALSSDTGNFSYGNTTPGALRLAATLREEGLDIAAIREKLENNWSETKLRLWGRLMSETRILEDGKLAVALVTRQLLAETGASREDAEGFVEQLRRLTGVRVAMLLREEEKDGALQTKASLRSSGTDNVRDAAAQFGGGGHKNAAGATVTLDAEKTLMVMLPYIRFVWNKLH
jgi:phosphoesterase RecJ-like protein